MTSPVDDTKTDSVRDMAKEQRSAKGSRGSIRLGRLTVGLGRFGVVGGLFPVVVFVVFFPPLGRGHGVS
jgi:hypothetical protein